eukprot:1160095-Pelagomonas_calceolata.AAC.11
MGIKEEPSMRKLDLDNGHGRKERRGEFNGFCLRKPKALGEARAGQLAGPPDGALAGEVKHG